MKSWRAYKSFVCYLLFFFSSIVSLFIASISVLLSVSNPSACQTAGRRWARFLLAISSLKITTSGLENIPKNQPVIFAANHQGAVDILLVLALIPVNFRFAIKEELFKIPIFGWHLTKSQYFKIKRSSILSVYRMTKDFVKALQSGDSILIFPEGTRSRTGELGAFKTGSLLVAYQVGVPVVPIAISGSYHFLQRGTWLLNPCPIKFSVGKPIKIASEEEYVQKLKEIRASIARML